MPGGRPARLTRQAAWELGLTKPRAPRAPRRKAEPEPPPAAACICDRRPGRYLAAALTLDGQDEAANQRLLAGFWRDHSGPGHTPVERLPNRPGKGDPKL